MVRRLPSQNISQTLNSVLWKQPKSYKIRAKYLKVRDNKLITVFVELKKEKIFKCINDGHVT